MTQFEQLAVLAKNRNGFLLTKDAAKNKISRTAFSAFVKKYKYEKMAHGIYLSPEAWYDTMYLLQLRCPNVIFSHGTALYLFDMTDRDPLRYTVTVKNGYNATRLKDANIKVFSVKKDFFKIGVVKVKNPFGNEVFTYNPERTLCDVIRGKKKLDIQLLQDGLKEYVLREDKNIPLLMEYAKIFRVKYSMEKYLEELL